MIVLDNDMFRRSQILTLLILQLFIRTQRYTLLLSVPSGVRMVS